MCSATGEDSKIDSNELAYPILGFWLDLDDEGERRNERFRGFDSIQEFHVATGGDLRLGRRLGMTILDEAGQTFQVANVSSIGFSMPRWRRVLMWITRDADSIEHRVEYSLVALPPMAFEEAKARVGASIQRNKDDWIDDEAMAGEAGEPMKLEDVIAGAVDAVRKATSVQTLFEGLDAAWPY
jgi:hypothetical protein